MPFAPATLVEDAEDCYFGLSGAEDATPFMTITFECTPEMRRKCPGVVHVGCTARPQLVSVRENVKKALKRVQRNGGCPGIDGRAVEELPGYLRGHWPVLRDQLWSGTSRPQPVKRVEIPKAGGGVCKRGIPTVVDRLHSAVDAPGAAEAMGPDVLGAQLWVPIWALRPSGRGQGAGIDSTGLSVGRRHRFGEIL